MPIFTVLCRADAYVDRIASIEADDAEEAAQLAQDFPEDYTWEHRGVQEFDARGYVALDDQGNEVEASRVGDW